MTARHAKPSNLTFFKTMAKYFVVIAPSVALSFLIAPELIVRFDKMPLYMRFPDSNPVLSRYSPNGFPMGARLGYSRHIVTAVREMDISLEHFELWIEEHPDTAIKHLRYMPEAMQKDAANIALYIRKSNPRIDAKTAWREAAALVHYSAKYGVPSALATAVAHVESTFNPDALSPVGASGVMQVMWGIHNGLLRSHGIIGTPGSNPLSDPEHSIAAGCLLLSRYIRASGCVQKAMDRYLGASSEGYRRRVNGNIARLMNHRAALFD